MRVLNWIFNAFLVLVFGVVIILSAAAGVDASFKFAFEPEFKLLRYPFQYGSDTCKAELSVSGWLVLIVGEQESGVFSYEEFRAKYPDSVDVLRNEQVASTSFSVVYGRAAKGAPGHAWLWTADGECPGNVYAVNAYNRVDLLP